MKHLQISVISLLSGVIFRIANAAVPCPLSDFRCLNGKCISSKKFCDKSDDCGDNSDEGYCGKVYCPSDWIRCPNRERCIPPNYKCDGKRDCIEQSEEINCGKNLLKVPGAFAAKNALESWIMNNRKTNPSLGKWGSHVHRMAVALHLADESTFDAGNATGDELRYELTLGLLRSLTRDDGMNPHELALYIQALVVACLDPKDFFGTDLVLELRRRVEATGNYTNPFLILALCNAGDTMTDKDVERLNAAFNARLRPSWTDVRSLAAMAFRCISSRSRNISQESRLWYMLQALDSVKLQGTPGDFRSTALLMQARLIEHSYTWQSFDINEAVELLVAGLEKKSVIHAYYALPVLSGKNLLGVTANHCSKESITEEEAVYKSLKVTGETILVQYSVWIGDETHIGQTWRLRIPENSTIYDAIETVAKIDNRQKVMYSMANRKPYVTAINGTEDDPEMGTYWFIYLKPLDSDEQPEMVKESPADVKLLPNQEIILWYKSGSWNGSV